MQLMRLILLLVICIDTYCQQVLPIAEQDGHIVVLVTDKQYKPHRLILDTGAVISVVYDMRLLDGIVKVDDSSLVSVDNSRVNVEYGGRLNLNFVDTYAYYLPDVESDNDGILGADWMIAHRAKIDLSKMVIEYE